jgi:3-oxoacyl-[acyl-carrier protein] reductase
MPNALVFGSSGTLGSAIARELLSRGYDCGLHYRANKSACETLSAEAATLQRKTVLYAGDFSDANAPGALVAQYLKDFGTIDALVWAAGISKDAPLLTQNEADLREVLNVNLKACFLVFKAVARQFIKQKSGSVVVLSSHAALSGRAGGTAYAMAEAGLLSLVKSAAREWGSLGVRVNAVLPPFVPESTMGRAASPEFAEHAKAKRVFKPDSDGIRATVETALAALSSSSQSGQVLIADSRIAV